MNDISPVAALRHGGLAVRRLTAVYPVSAFERRLTPTGWSGRDHLAHIARYQTVFHERMQRIRAETAPTFARYRGDDDDRFASYRALPLGGLLDRFDRDRAVLLAAIEGLGASELDRTGVHPAYGAITLRHWLDFMIAHEGHHYYQVMRCIAMPPGEGTAG